MYIIPLDTNFAIALTNLKINLKFYIFGYKNSSEPQGITFKLLLK